VNASVYIGAFTILILKKERVLLKNMSVFSKTRNSRIRLIIAVILTLLAGASIYYYLMSVHHTVPVVVASRDIAPNTVINNDDVCLVDLSVDSKHQQAFSNPKEVIGSKTKETVYKDMQLITPQIGDKDDNSLKAGEMLLPLKDVIISPGLRAGNLVNITVVRPEGVFFIEGAWVYQVKNDNEIVLAVNEDKALQIIETAADAKSIYVLVRR
jgi:hypothetical protein